MKNRRIIGTPQNSSIEDEIRQIFIEYYLPKVVKDKVMDHYYNIYLPPKTQFLGFDIIAKLEEFCRIHRCKWWTGVGNSIYNGMWVRIGHFQHPSPSV